MTRLGVVFAAGDVAHSVRDVVTAIGSGKTSVCPIDAWLLGNSMDQDPETRRIGSFGAVSFNNYLNSTVSPKLTLNLQSHSKSRGSSIRTEYADLSLNYFKVLAHEKIHKLEILESLTGFDEVNLGLIVDGALKEATRCFQC